jgi:hypothetical protein
MDECDGRELIRAVRAAIDPSGASKSSRGSGGKSSVDKSSGTGHGADGNGSGGDGGGGFALSNGDEECGSDDAFADEYHAMQMSSHAPYFEAQLNALRTGVIDALGEDFDAVYSYLLHARSKKVSDATIQDFLQSNYADRLDHCFLCDYLVRELACCLLAACLLAACMSCFLCAIEFVLHAACLPMVPTISFLDLYMMCVKLAPHATFLWIDFAHSRKLARGSARALTHVSARSHMLAALIFLYISRTHARARARTHTHTCHATPPGLCGELLRWCWPAGVGAKEPCGDGSYGRRQVNSRQMSLLVPFLQQYTAWEEL